MPRARPENEVSASPGSRVAVRLIIGVARSQSCLLGVWPPPAGDRPGARKEPCWHSRKSPAGFLRASLLSIPLPLRARRLGPRFSSGPPYIADVEAMPTLPSIKGSIFGRAVEDVLKLVSAGTLSRSELQRWLRPEDIAVLDKPLLPSSWCDVQAYGRVLELLKDVEGKGRTEYLRQRGAASAEMLRQTGIYQQMEYLNRTQASQQKDPRARSLAFGRDLRLLTTIYGSILNFGRQVVKDDPEHDDRYLLEYQDVASYPEALCWTTDGFVNRMAKQHGQPDLWTWERRAPELIVYRMTRSI